MRTMKKIIIKILGAIRKIALFYLEGLYEKVFNQ